MGPSFELALRWARRGGRPRRQLPASGVRAVAVVGPLALAGAALAGALAHGVLLLVGNAAHGPTWCCPAGNPALPAIPPPSSVPRHCRAQCPVKARAGVPPPRVYSAGVRVLRQRAFAPRPPGQQTYVRSANAQERPV